jgi:hypothetical protein
LGRVYFNDAGNLVVFRELFGSANHAGWKHSETYDDTVLISGSATRSAGRQVSGLFAPFGGDWSFSGSIVNGNDARSVAGAATIFGDTATVYPDGESPVDVVATGLGVDINGSFLPKR